MPEARRLVLGMDFKTVSRVLEGWKAEPAGTVVSLDKQHVFHTWDFIPPTGRDRPPLRLTFANGRLTTWGEPSNHPQQPEDMPSF